MLPVPSKVVAGSAEPLLCNEVRDAVGFCRRITGRVALIVDNSNILRAGRHAHFRIDYQQLKVYLGGGEAVSAHLIASQPAFVRPQQQAFYAFMQRYGWTVELFAPLVDSWGAVSENELQVDGAVRDAIRRAAADAWCDACVVLSGDGGMTNAVKFARRSRKDVFVIAWADSLNPALAQAATAAASIESLRALITRRLS